MIAMRLWGSIFAFCAVVLGAFASHALKDRLALESLESFQVGVRYMMYHALALLLFSLIHPEANSLQRWTLILFVVGIFLFSGSIFILATQTIHQLKVSFLGPITPLGGMCLIVGWALQIIHFFKNQ